MPSVAILATASGSTSVVAAPGAGKKIRVWGYQITSRAAIDEVQLRSASTVMAYVESVAAAGGGICCPPVTGQPYFECAGNEALNVNLSAAGNVGVNVQYDVLRT